MVSYYVHFEFIVVDRIYKIEQDLHVNSEKSCKSCLRLLFRKVLAGLALFQSLEPGDD